MDDYFAGASLRMQSPPAPAPPPPAGPNRLLIGLLVAFGALVMVGMLAAVVIPQFLDGRDLSRITAVSAPDSVLGMPRLTDAVSAAAQERLLGLPGPGDHVAGVYGVEQVRLLVGAARYRLGPAERRDFLEGASAEVGKNGMALHEVDAGALGGTFRCGTQTDGLMTLCVFVDGGSYGLVVLTGGSDDDVGTARSAREAFVRRT